MADYYGANNKIRIDQIISELKTEGADVPCQVALQKRAEEEKQNEVKKIKDKNDWGQYQNIINEKIRKEWKNFGKTARDWT